MLRIELDFNFLCHLSTYSSPIFLILNVPIGLAATSSPVPTVDNSHPILAQATPTPPRPDFQRSAPQPIELPQPQLPPSPDLLPTVPAPSLPARSTPQIDLPESIVVNRFEVKGSTVFSPADLAQITGRYTNKPLDFTQLLQVASEITQLYVKNGYINSGAYIPGDRSFAVTGGTVEIQVIEGKVADIVVEGTKKLDPNYIKSRIDLGAGKVLKIDRLIDRLRLLQLDPLIKSISTELASGQQIGTSIVRLQVDENPNWQTGLNIANNRSPSVGETQAQISLAQTNLTGIGDSIGIAYGRGVTSNIWDFNYTLPLNPRNGTLRFQSSISNSRVIESPFDRLDISSNSQDLGLTYRQPLLQTPSQEFALGMSLARRETTTGYLQSLLGQSIPYPSVGADANGSTRVTAARFFQDYTSRDTQQVFALRSQLSLGLNALGATTNVSSADSQFLAWRGQAQYVRALAPNSILLVKLESQLADRPLLAIEQIGVGGQDTVRGYRQDLLLADNGAIASAEIRLPIFTPPDSKQVLQIVPFLDFGVGWNQPNNPSANPTPSSIFSGGLGLRYQNGENFTARLDYGIPFTSIDSVKRTWQEHGLYFSLNYNRSF